MSMLEIKAEIFDLIYKRDELQIQINMSNQKINEKIQELKGLENSTLETKPIVKQGE